MDVCHYGFLRIFGFRWYLCLWSYRSRRFRIGPIPNDPLQHDPRCHRYRRQFDVSAEPETELTVSAAYFVQQYKRKAPVLLVILMFPVAAAAALYALPRDNNQALMAVYFILQIFQPLTPIVFSWT